MNVELLKEFTPDEVENALKQMAPLKSPGPDGMPPLFYQNYWSLSAFMADRLISDNIMVAFEMLHYMRSHSLGNTGYMALNLDMSKAYDRVEWLYMEKLMRKMGFAEAWVKLMMKSISTAIYSVLINGEPQGHITPTRGLRQGDPLSPYLFLMCTEGFHGLLKKAETMGDIRGVSICRNGPRLTHLLFANDSLIFCRAKESEREKLLEVLAKYEGASGQQINRDKTTLFFSKSTPQAMQNTIKTALGVPVVQHYEKYLGLPSFIRRRKKESFDNIKQRVWKRLQGWEGKLITQAGREILIKQIAQALPTYAMSCLKLPIGLCHDIEALVKKFFWGQRGENRKIHWTKWEELCKPKSQGGMGFKGLSRFNDALLAKQAWRLLHDKTSLFYRVFKAKYFPNCTIMEANNPGSASYVWKSIIKGREVIQKGAVWRIGDGRSVSIWGTRWLPTKYSLKIVTPCTGALVEAKVDVLIDTEHRAWKEDLLDANLLSFEAEMIKKIPLSHTDQVDTLTWPFTLTGDYSVKSRYTFLQQEYQNSQPGQSVLECLKPLWKSIWSLQVPSKVKNFIWRAAKNSLPTKANLVKRKIISEDLCEQCRNQKEDAVLALYLCPKLLDLWTKVELWNHSRLKQATSFIDLIGCVFANNRDPTLFSMVAWAFWNRRNNLRLGKPAVPVNELLAISKQCRLRGDYLQCRGAGHGLSLSEKTTLPFTAIEVEAMAARRALTLALETGFQPIILEGDSQTLISALENNTHSLSSFGHIMKDIQYLASSLARRAVSLTHMQVWMEDVPLDISHVL
ncbi:uncharacterized protein LOC142611959 [Castanea sativa]|uniref:uncharacterized protein LOC142611959 n=1 Tax=Castanea sativa TaxID=21020 RepID=UPI003F64EB65